MGIMLSGFACVVLYLLSFIGALEYGSVLHVNERQKIRRYCARSTEE